MVCCKICVNKWPYIARTKLKEARKMNAYEKPEITILQFKAVDIIATSNNINSADIDDESTSFDGSWLEMLSK